MLAPSPRITVAIAALLGLLSMGTFCILDDPRGIPPSPSFACAAGDPPEEGAAPLFFSAPEGGASPLAPDATLAIEYGNQGGQHVTVALRHHAAAAGVWTYRLGFEQSPPEAEAAQSTPKIEGANTVPVDACPSGWTETRAPLFIDILQYGEPNAAGETLDPRGVLRVIATHVASDAQLSAEIPVQIDL